MSRALVIAPTPSHPLDQGNRIRVAQMALALKARGFIVDFLYYALDGVAEGSIDTMRDIWDTVHVVGPGPFIPYRRFPEVWGLDDWIAPQAISVVRSLAESYDYSLVMCNYVWCSALLEPFRGTRTKRVIDAHDAFGDRHKLTRDAGIDAHWYYTSLSEEGRGFDRADLVLAIQEHEGRQFREYTRTPVEVIEFSMPRQTIRPDTGGRIRVGYLGSGNPWNVRSIQAFDRLLAAAPDREALEARFDFRLYGGITRTVRECEVFTVLGPVEEAKHFYEEVDVVINPMVGGTGLKIKTVEALAYGLPVISTAAGGAGLEHIHPDICIPDLDALIDRLRSLNSRQDLEALTRAMQQGYDTFHAGTETKIDKMLAQLDLNGRTHQGASGRLVSGSTASNAGRDWFSRLTALIGGGRT